MVEYPLRQTVVDNAVAFLRFSLSLNLRLRLRLRLRLNLHLRLRLRLNLRLRLRLRLRLSLFLCLFLDSTWGGRWKADAMVTVSSVAPAFESLSLKMSMCVSAPHSFGSLQMTPPSGAPGTIGNLISPPGSSGPSIGSKRGLLKSYAALTRRS